MDPIVDTVLDIISKCVVAAVRHGLEAESTIAGDLIIYQSTTWTKLDTLLEESTTLAAKASQTK